MSGKYEFKTEINLRGVWWLPELPEKKIPGSVCFNQIESCILELEGTFVDTEPMEGSLGSYPIVYGMTMNGEACSLVDVHEASKKTGLKGIPCLSLFFNRLFIGREEFNPKRDLVESATVRFSIFKYWMHRDPIKMDNKRKRKGIPEGKISFELPEDESFWVNSLNAYVRFESSANTQARYQYKSVELDEKLRVVPKRKQKLEWFEQVIYRLRILFGLLSGNPANILSIDICPGRRRQNIPNIGIRLIREDVSFLFRPILNSQRRQAKHPFDIPFSYPSIGSNAFKKVLNTWFENTQTLETLSALYFVSSINSQMPTEYRFLSFIQALESYSRSKGSDKYMDQTQYGLVYQKLINAIPAKGVDSSHRNSLKKRIEYGNEYSLIKRFSIMVKSLPPEIKNRVTENDSKFVKRLVDTRNYLTHRGETSQGLIMSSNGIYNCSEKLKFMIEYFLLTECGLEVDLITKVMTSHRMFTDRPKIT